MLGSRFKRIGLVGLKGGWCSALVFALWVPAAVGQRPVPLPTPAQQADIDKDTSRHFGNAPADPGPLAADLSASLTPAAIDAATRKVADWELANWRPWFDQTWTSSVLYTGLLAASKSTGDSKYRDAMVDVAKKYDASLKDRLPNADAQSIAQMYLDLYLEDGKKDAALITPTRKDLDSVIDLNTLKPNDPRIPWWWCDALFMAPPVWVRMYAATGDRRYVDYVDKQWATTSGLLYDKDEHLYARDESYKSKRGPNGKKIFWSRGEGWVMAGIARTLPYLPANDPHRAFYEQQLREMAERIASLQDKDGLWYAALLDPEDYPLPEVSGSALFTFAMAWGVNEGVLDATKYRPVIEKAWRGMLRHVYADGRLGCIQQTGAEPAFYPPGASFDYGVGAFLLAASEIKRMVLHTAAASASASTISVASFGAKPNSTALSTEAIQAAIDAAAVSSGTVTFPPGTYRTGSVFVKSGVTLRIDKGVTLLGSQNIADYPERPTRIAGIELTWPSALINVYGQDHAAITGEGTIDGDGKVFWDSYWALRKIDEPIGLRWASDYDARRPRLIQVFDSSHVQLGGGLHLQRSGFWTVHICYSHDVTVDGVTIDNNIGGRGPSTDGIDIDSSHHIEVMHADITVNDDALCLKAGRDSDGLRVNRPTTDVRIHDNIVREGAAGVTFGSETSGGFENVEVWNITTLAKVPNGILFKSAHTRGGTAHNIRLHDFNITGARSVFSITMNWNPSYSYAKIPDGLKSYPAYYKVMTTVVPEAQGIAHVRDVHIWNIKAVQSKAAFAVEAYAQAPLTDFTFDHLDLQTETAGKISDASHWTFANVKLQTRDGSTVGVSESKEISGLAMHEVPVTSKSDPAKQSFADQDKL